MERWFLAAATLFALVGGIQGMCAVHHGHRSRLTMAWMALCLICQFGFLWLRGEARGACPLADGGEILAFMAWSLTLFYIIVGPAYRISLLGVFTAPVVVVVQGIALIPGMLDVNPVRVTTTDAWKETHSAMSVLSYGALALAAIAGVMFLVLDRQLKEHHLKSGLFRNLPPVRELLVSLVRLLWIGTMLLTIGIAAGLFTPRQPGYLAHLIAATVVWLGYAALLWVNSSRGLTGRRLSWLVVGLFISSLVVFALV
ncbi:MAG: cytochrome c biogenesis protein CcsA [Verrucomicrobiota bacterium]